MTLLAHSEYQGLNSTLYAVTLSNISLSMLKLQTAAAKGLVAGCFLITREDGTQVDGMDDEEV